MVCCEAYNYLDNQLNNTYMKTTFNVEILGYERSLYGGEDGHYCGTTVTPNEVVDFMELSEEYSDMLVRFYASYTGTVYVQIIETRPYLYWSPQSYRCLVNPSTHDGSFRFSDKFFESLILKKLGWDKYEKGRFAEYSEARRSLLDNRITVKDLQEMLK
jgi:hypothetical protein